MINSIGSNSYANIYTQSKSRQINNAVTSISHTDTTGQGHIIRFSTDSDGTKQLTADEDKELSEKYNVSNMTEVQQLQLLGDLTTMGVVSSADFFHASLMVQVSRFAEMIPQSTDSRITTVSNVKAYDSSKNYNWIEEHLDDAQSELKAGKTTQAESDSRIAEILEQLDSK
jgi:hypothetical protein